MIPRWLFVVFCLSALWPCTRQALCADQAESKESSPAAAEFQKAYDSWRKVSRKLQQLGTLYDNSNESQRAKIRPQYASAVDESNAALTQMLPALQKAYEADPKNRELVELMVQIARLAYDGDRYEITFPLTMALARDYDDKASVHNLAGLAAYELGDLKEAKIQLERSRDLGGLVSADAVVVERLLANLPERQSFYDAEMARRAKEARLNNLPRVKLQTTRGDIVIELFEDDVPNTVASFLGLVEDGFYDGLEFFRVSRGFGAVAGSPTNDGKGGPGFETLKEPGNNRPHLRGVLSMMPLTDRTNGSQFFITLSTRGAERLDGKQTVFGRVIDGMDVVERLHRVEPQAHKGAVDPDRILEASVLRKRQHKYTGYSTAEIGQEKYLDGLKLFAQSKFKESADSFREALKYLPDNYSLEFNLAAALLNQREFNEAEKHLREALRINPKHVKAHYFLGYVLAVDGRKEESEQHLKEAIRLDPTNRAARDLLKKVQTQLQKLELQ